MASYTAGNLQISLSALADKNLDTSITKVTKQLSNLSSVVKSVTTNDLKWVTSLGTRLKTLSKTMSEKVDFAPIQNGFNQLTLAITPFIDKVSSAKEELMALNGIIQKVSGKRMLKNLTSLGEEDTASEKKKKSGWASIGNVVSFSKVLFLSRQLARSMANIVQYGVDFTETLNLWQVAMKDNLDQADEFIKKMNKAYGISQQTLMNAQATFKNMIGSLGDISSATSMALSESILQMALDFSSLYNTTFENAIQKFEAVLAGQVRPIRTGSGYDITQTTLYALYQQLGGTKTQQQLNMTEKRLLSILAIFQQMQRSGAVGDLSKTLDNFANQSRMMTENFKELKTYIGLFVQDLLQSWGVLKYINAGLIFATELVKAMTTYETPNFIEGMFETTTAENEALDELQGKLLDFDKFRALNGGATSNTLAIDDILLQQLSSYTSILSEANNEARALATEWLKATGIIDKDGKVVAERAKEIKNNIVAITSAIGGIATAITAASLVNLAKRIMGITSATQLLSAVISTTLIYIVVRLFQNIKDGNGELAMLDVVIGVALVGSFIALNREMLKTTGIKIISFFQNMQLQGALATTTIQQLKSAFGYLGLAITVAVGTFSVLSLALNAMPEEMKKVLASISIVCGALATVLGLVLAIKGGLKGGLLGAVVAGVGFGALVAGITAVANSTKNNIPKYAMGASDIDSGTMFIAGEAGRTEAVYTGSNGKTNVANIKQMNQAFNGALTNWWRSARNDIPQFKEVSKSGIYEINKSEMKRRGEW